jgi:hypothetical protein
LLVITVTECPFALSLWTTGLLMWPNEPVMR